MHANYTSCYIYIAVIINRREASATLSFTNAALLFQGFLSQTGYFADFLYNAYHECRGR
jgi:hypothetical protein